MGLKRDWNGTIARSFKLDEGKKIGLSRLARLKQIRDTLMLAVANGQLYEVEAVSAMELDKLVNEIEGGSKKAGQSQRWSVVDG